jgi:heme/copper-type cytochrome/quinol oxidase subunit 3
MSDVPFEQRPLPVGGVGRIGVGWWGLLCVIATEGSLFAYLLFSYFYFAVQLDGGWMPEAPSFEFSLPAVILLILSGIAVWWGARASARGARGRFLIGFLLTLLLGLGFIALQWLEWRSKPFTMQSGEYGSIFFTVTGWHLAHLVAGVIGLVLILIWSALGYFDDRRNAPVLIAAGYWHFVVAVGVAVFLALYVTSYLW